MSAELGLDGFRDILVPQDESEAALNALAFADGLGAAFGAHLTGLMFGLVPYYPMSLASSSAPEGWIHAQQQASEEAADGESRLKARYAKLAASHEFKRDLLRLPNGKSKASPQSCCVSCLDKLW